MSGWRNLALGLALVLLGAGTARAQAAPEEEAAAGPLVTAIEVRSDAPLDPELEAENLIEIEAGKPLDVDEVRHTLRNLQATGTATAIELYTREDPAGGGVVAMVVFRAAVLVEEIRIDGEPGLPRGDLQQVLVQHVGEALSEDAVLKGVYQLQDLYERSGYFQSKSVVDVATDEARRRAVVTYRVTSGPRAAVSTIVFDHPVDPFEPAALVRQLRLKPGDLFRRRVAREDAERLQDWLIRQGHGAARVDSPREAYDPEGNTVTLTYPIEVGARISVVVEGAEEKTLRRKGLLPFLDPTGFDEALVIQSQSLIRDYYQGEGHYDVEVETREDRQDRQLVVHVRVAPGPEYTLQEIAFQGNDEVPATELRQVMTTVERSVLRPGSGRLVQSVLDQDLDKIRSYYALQGYTKVEAGPPEVTRQGQDLRLLIPVREGVRQRVVKIDFEGVEALDQDAVRKNLPLKEGGGFHPVLLDNSLEGLRGEYAARGYAEAQVSAAQDWNPEHTLVDLLFKVIEGPKQVADRVIVRGARRTRADVIRRALDLDSGDPISDTRLFETERNLYRLGIFSQANVELIGAGFDETERDVLVRVEEGKARTVRYGLGYDSEDQFRGLVGFTDNNVFGRAYSLRTDLRWSVRDQRFHLLFNQPYLGEHPVALTSALFYENERPRDRPYQVTRYGARTEAARVYGNRRVSVGLDYRIVETDVDPGFATNELERRDQPYQVTSLVPNFFWDRRDDPIQTTRGWSSLLQIQYAFPVPAVRTDTEFLKLFLQQTQYFTLGRPGVIATSLRAGAIQPYKALPTRAGLPLLPFPSKDIPITERFFAGGDATHRAYGRDELGIRGESLILNPDGGADDYVPVGGAGLFLLNVEYRFPVFGPFGGTIFFDSGNVWGEWRGIDLGELKNGIGIGARYISPIGPIRAGIGWKLAPEKGEPGYALFVNIGNPF